MSDYHILTCNKSRTLVEVVYHFAIPNENNFAGTNLRTALRQYEPAYGSHVPWLTAGTEYDNIQAGAVYEKHERYTVDEGLTKAQVRTAIDTRFTDLNGKVPDKIATYLDFWGLDRDVP